MDPRIYAVIAYFYTLYLIYLFNHVNRRYWVHPLNQTRDESSVRNRVEAMRQYPERFYSYFRMTPQTFDYILRNIRTRITRMDTQMRKAIDPETRLYVTLHYLATGSSYNSIAFHYALGKSTVSGIIIDTCKAIVEVLGPVHLQAPQSQEDWKSIAEKFYERWDFPNLVGAVDGKHIRIRAPDRSGSSHYNYKKTFSVNLMAVVDAAYKFVIVDIGQAGSASDAGVWENSVFGNAWNKNEVNVPPPTRLPGSDTTLPYVLVGDEGFPLKPTLMRPYSRDPQASMMVKRFNYRLSRARRVVENAFGILAARWRFLYTLIDADDEKVSYMVNAACILHNLLCDANDDIYTPPGYSDTLQTDGSVTEGLWRTEQQLDDASVNMRRYRNPAVRATQVRLKFTDWFSGPGSRHFQDTMINQLA